MRRNPIVLACSLMIFLGATTLHASWDDGVSAFKAGRYDEAAAAFLSYVDSRPEVPAGHYMLGQALLRQQRFDDALEPLGEAVALGSGESRYVLALAQAQIKAGKAEAGLDTLVAADPGSVPDAMRPDFNQLLVQAAIASDRGEVALAGLEKAVAADPAERNFHVALAQVAGRHGEPERAFDALAAAYDLDPRDAEAGRGAVRKAMDIAYEEDQDKERKLDWYRKGAELAGKLATTSPTPENQKLAGEAAMGAKDYEGAAARLGQALAAGIDDRRLRYYLGRSHLALGNDEQALVNLQAALEREGDELVSEIHTARASALRNLERFDDAAEAYGKAGRAGKASEMADYAEHRREWAAKTADCVEKRAQITVLLEDDQGLKDSPEWKDLEQQATEILAACEPYLKETS